MKTETEIRAYLILQQEKSRELLDAADDHCGPAAAWAMGAAAALKWVLGQRPFEPGGVYDQMKAEQERS